MQPAHTARSTTLDELPYDSGLIETKGALMAHNMLDPKIVTESEIRELPLFIKIYGGRRHLDSGLPDVLWLHCPATHSKP